MTAPSDETCKYAMAPITQTNLDRLATDMLLSVVPVLVVALLSSEVMEGLMNYPVYTPPSPVKHKSVANI
jgi:hypothetical protein